MTSSDVSISYIPCIMLNLSVITLAIQVCGLSPDMATSCRVDAIFSNPTGLPPAQSTVHQRTLNYPSASRQRRRRPSSRNSSVILNIKAHEANRTTVSTNTCTSTAARCCSYQTDGPAVATKVIFFLPPYTLCSRDFCSGAIRHIRASRHMLHTYIRSPRDDRTGFAAHNAEQEEVTSGPLAKTSRCARPAIIDENCLPTVHLGTSPIEIKPV